MLVVLGKNCLQAVLSCQLFVLRWTKLTSVDELIAPLATPAVDLAVASGGGGGISWVCEPPPLLAGGARKITPLPVLASNVLLGSVNKKLNLQTLYSDSENFLQTMKFN
jgi:hypothetical protein